MHCEKSDKLDCYGNPIMDYSLHNNHVKSCIFLILGNFLFALQIVIWFILPAIKSSEAHSTDNTLVLIVLLQYIPRLYLIFPLSSQIIKATGVVTKTAWAGAAYNLLLYMLASHVCNFSLLIFDNPTSNIFSSILQRFDFCSCRS